MRMSCTSQKTRYAVLVKAKNLNDPGICNSYRVHGDLDLNMYDNPPDTLDAFPRARLYYDLTQSDENCNGQNERPEYNVEEEEPDWEYPSGDVFDEGRFRPLDGGVKDFHLLKPDITLSFNVNFQLHTDGMNHGTFNDRIFQFPIPKSMKDMGKKDNGYRVIPMFTGLTLTGNQSMQLDEDDDGAGNYPGEAYGPHNTIYPLPGGCKAGGDQDNDGFCDEGMSDIKLVEIRINNYDAGNHPFHLHGHDFFIVAMGRGGKSKYDPEDIDTITWNNTDNPTRRDVVTALSEGFVVIRFFTDNVGAWIFHCHVEWHLEAGLAAVLMVGPDKMNNTIHPPQVIRDHCRASGWKVEGNAAGYMDATTMDKVMTWYAPWPEGIDLKGGLLLTIDILSAILGFIVIYMHVKREFKQSNNDSDNFLSKHSSTFITQEIGQDKK